MRDSCLHIIGVDLGPLELAGVVDIADLRLGIELVDLPSTLPVAIAGCLDAAEREVRLGPDGGCVDISDAVVQLLHGAEGQVDAPGVNRAGESVSHVVVHPDCLIKRFYPYHTENRSENLLL